MIQALIRYLLSLPVVCDSSIVQLSSFTPTAALEGGKTEE